MCGIYGVVSLRDPIATDPEVLRAMGETLVHRGPDGEGTYVDSHAAIGIRLLRIVDHSNPVTQPFRDPVSGVVIVCNGEIYNAPQLRRDYPDYPYSTASDVEPILPLYRDLGPRAIDQLEGMFAVAIWDPNGTGLLLARDPQGEKPLFAATPDGLCVFGSEIQTLLAHPAVGRQIDPSAVRDIVTLGYTLGTRTLFAGVASVAPGTATPPEESTGDCMPRLSPAGRVSDDPTGDLDALLRAAVGRQMQADVPIGVFMSGGVDSALLAAYASHERHSAALHSFAVGFEVPSYDERSPARAVARRLGLAHTEIIASQTDLAQELVNVVERVAEPIADPAVLPTAILARAAGRHVGVVLSGEGADELFGGYPTYLGHHWSDAYCRLPVSVRHGIRGILHRMPSSHAKVPLRWLLRRFVDHASRPTLDRHIAWFGAQIGPVAQPEDIRSIWQKSAQSFTELSRMMYLDYCTYLRALLVKIDRATMLASLESRAPYLDGTVTGFAWALPDRLKVRGIRTKVLLKQVAMRYLPGRIVHRRKRGLSVPVSQLMGRELCAEFERHVCDDRFAHLDLFPPGRVGEIVSEHETGRAHHARALWTLMVLGMWTEKWTGA